MLCQGQHFPIIDNVSFKIITYSTKFNTEKNKEIRLRLWLNGKALA
jgi:hypothetical protein